MATWNLDDIHKIEELNPLLDELKRGTKDIQTSRDILKASVDPSDLVKILNNLENLGIISSRLGSRAMLKLTERMTDPEANSVNDRIMKECTMCSNETIFISLWLKSLDDEVFNKLLSKSGPYTYHLKRVRAFKDHMLDESEEKIINLKDLTGSDALVKIYETITSRFRFKYNDNMLNIAQVNRLKMSGNRADRMAGHDLLLTRYHEEREVLGEIYRNLVNDWVTETKSLRRYDDPMDVRNMSNDIPSGAVEAMLSTIDEKGGVFRDFFKAKADLLGMDNFDRYDLYAPYGVKGGPYSYERSKEEVLKHYRRFDPEMGSLAERIFTEGHVHSDTISDKQPGAFCMSYAPGKTPYILLNHQDDTEDLFTMMHEIGHGIHSMLAKDNTYFTFHSSLVLAETASLFGELLLAKSLVAQGGDLAKFVLVRILDSQYASIGRQAHFTMFERYAHKAVPEGANLDDMDEEYLRGLRQHLGPMDIPELFENEWLYISHFFGSPFYCYSYCMGSLVVLSLYSKYEKEGSAFVNSYKDVLSRGGSESPANILSAIGLDICSKDFWAQGFDVMKDQIKGLKSLSCMDV